MSGLNRTWVGLVAVICLGATAYTAPVGIEVGPGDLDQSALERVLTDHGPVDGDRYTLEMTQSWVEDWAAVEAREAERGEVIHNFRQRAGRPGQWMTPPGRATRPTSSGVRYIMNEWGDTQMGIGFPEVVDVQGVHIFGQGLGRGVFAPAVRVHGYLEGDLIATTEWFERIGDAPEWFAIDLEGVDRIVIEAQGAIRGAGWYGLDDLTFRKVGGDRVIVLDFEDLAPRTRLTETNYAGLSWEVGTGPIEPDQDLIPAPQPTPGELIESDDDVLEAEIPDRPEGVRAASEPNIIQTFRGPRRGDNNQFSFPPDTHGAIGPDHFVSVVNTIFQVYNRSGSLQSSVSLQSFLPGTSGDPRVLYDNHSDRWIVISTNFGSRIDIAVSRTSNPLGLWFKGNFTAAAGSDSGCWVDYPTVGYDENGIYIGAFMVGCGHTVWALEKAPLLTSTPAFGAITAFRQIEPSTIQPVQSYDAGSNAYMVSVFNSSNVGVRRIIGPISAPGITSRQVVSVGSSGFPPTAPALGANTNLDTVGNRIMNAVFRNGRLYASQTISLNNRAAVRYFGIHPTNFTVVESGTVGHPTLHLFFPSVAVNDRGDVLLGFTGSNDSQFPACYVSGRSVGDPPGQMSPIVEFRAGVASQNLIDQFGRNRYGDYSMTSVDPNDDLTFWTIQQYNSSQDIWATWVAEVSFDEPDCNNNGVPDSQDIANGTSEDINGNGIPDECEFAGPFSLLTPPNGATGIDPAAFNTLTWEAAINAEKYVVTIATSPGFAPGSLVVGPIDRSQPNLTVFSGTFQEATDYYWRVIAVSQGNETESTPAVSTFRTVDPAPACSGDINGDGRTDLDDFAILALNFGVGPGATMQQGDLNGDGFVNLDDFAIIAIDFGCLE